MKKTLLTIGFLALLGGVSFASDNILRPEQLKGKWEGTPPLGGRLELEIDVKGSEIEGTGLIRLARGRALHPIVSGTVNGTNVYFETHFPGTNDTAKYTC